ncbi:MAG: DUF2829 domain-containing protein [Ignavibacteria bacterium]|jgi:hypothetical protein
MKKIVMFFVLIFQFIGLSFQRKVFAEEDNKYQSGDCENTKAPINLSFGDALQLMKSGHKVCREGWNGKGMWICIGNGICELEADKFWNVHTKEFARSKGGSAEVLPYIIMKTADNKVLMGWLASQTDMLANDWMLV